ncbi:hypothetical protein MRX96_053625 [Rhipicephalus microplus]
MRLPRRRRRPRCVQQPTRLLSLKSPNEPLLEKSSAPSLNSVACFEAAPPPGEQAAVLRDGGAGCRGTSQQNSPRTAPFASAAPEPNGRQESRQWRERGSSPRSSAGRQCQ